MKGEEASFRAQYLGLYTDLVDPLIKLVRADEAVRVTEAARARALLAMLAERDVVHRDLPTELEILRQAANAAWEEAMAALADADGDE